MYAELASTGDFRRGSISENYQNYRRCGKPNCACAQRDRPGHGPRYLWTRTVAGRGTKGRQLSAAEVDKVRAELANYQRFAQVSDQIVEVNEAICEARPTGWRCRSLAFGRHRGRKKGFYDQLAAEVAAEVDRLAAVAADALGSGAGLAPVELAIRTAMTTADRPTHRRNGATL